MPLINLTDTELNNLLNEQRQIITSLKRKIYRLKTHAYTIDPANTEELKKFWESFCVATHGMGNPDSSLK